MSDAINKTNLTSYFKKRNAYTQISVVLQQFITGFFFLFHDTSGFMMARRIQYNMQPKVPAPTMTWSNIANNKDNEDIHVLGHNESFRLTSVLT